MNPDLEFFLEDALNGIQPSLQGVGRVVLEPDYDVNPVNVDKQALAAELSELLSSHAVDTSAVQTVEGQSVQMPESLRILSKYIRSITLHADSVEGSWIEVAPPGNWI